MRGDAGYPVRLRFTKRGKVRWTGHRDVARAVERALRIEQLPLAFSGGFSPRPKISFGLALSVGYESDAEYLDVQLASPIDLDRLPAALSAALPEGLEVTGAVPLADRAPALQEAVTAVEWLVAVTAADRETPVAPPALAAVVAEALTRPELPTTRRRKGSEVVEDVRPAIRRAEVTDPSPDLHVVGRPTATLTLECATHPRSPKPDEVLAAIDEALAAPGGLAAARVLRIRQSIERDGARLEPMAADPRPHVPEARAS